jgi:hypothetical protein
MNIDVLILAKHGLGHILGGFWQTHLVTLLYTRRLPFSFNAFIFYIYIHV